MIEYHHRHFSVFPKLTKFSLFLCILFALSFVVDDVFCRFCHRCRHSPTCIHIVLIRSRRFGSAWCQAFERQQQFLRVCSGHTCHTGAPQQLPGGLSRRIPLLACINHRLVYLSPNRIFANCQPRSKSTFPRYRCLRGIWRQHRETTSLRPWCRRQESNPQTPAYKLESRVCQGVPYRHNPLLYHNFRRTMLIIQTTAPRPFGSLRDV